jgi:hypothetical protein
MATVSGGGARAKRRDIRPLGAEDGHAAVARLPPGGRHLVCAFLRRAVRVEVREVFELPDLYPTYRCVVRTETAWNLAC